MLGCKDSKRQCWRRVRTSERVKLSAGEKNPPYEASLVGMGLWSIRKDAGDNVIGGSKPRRDYTPPYGVSSCPKD